MHQVFLVDDDREFLYEISEALSSDGFQIQTAQDPLRALGKIKRLNPDLVILDLDMPGMNGMELLKQLRETSTGSSVPVILLTGNGNQHILETGFREGLDDYLTKPVSHTELTLRLKALLKRSHRDRFAILKPSATQAVLDKNKDLSGLLLWIPEYARLPQSDLAHLKDELDEVLLKLIHSLRDTITHNRVSLCAVECLSPELFYFSLSLDLHSIAHDLLLKSLALHRRLWQRVWHKNSADSMIISGDKQLHKSKLPQLLLFKIQAKYRINIMEDLKLALSLIEKTQEIKLLEF